MTFESLIKKVSLKDVWEKIPLKTTILKLNFELNFELKIMKFEIKIKDLKKLLLKHFLNNFYNSFDVWKSKKKLNRKDV